MNKNLTMVMTFATENKVPTVAGDNLNSSVVDDMISILRKIVEIVENSNFYKTKYSKSDQEIPENSVNAVLQMLQLAESAIVQELFLFIPQTLIGSQKQQMTNHKRESKREAKGALSQLIYTFCVFSFFK